jgi:hypothetical protein
MAKKTRTPSELDGRAFPADAPEARGAEPRMKVKIYHDRKAPSDPAVNVTLHYFETAVQREARHAEEIIRWGIIQSFEKPVYSDPHERYRKPIPKLGWTQAPSYVPPIGNDLLREQEVKRMRRLHKVYECRIVRGNMDPDVVSAKWEELNARQGGL